MNIEQMEMVCILRLLINRQECMKESIKLGGGVYPSEEANERVMIIGEVIKNLAADNFDSGSWQNILSVIRVTEQENIKGLKG